tara:strand:- start:135 stop:290 length:156 start_codon:yes stop_codon:yes gene_type:complete
MKPGDKVLRKWKPKYGEGKVVHVLGETIVVLWTGTGVPKIEFEEKKYLKLI